MRIVERYRLEPHGPGPVKLLLPEGAQPISADEIGDGVVVWVAVDPALTRSVTRHFRLVEDNQGFPDNFTYVTTFWHRYYGAHVHVFVDAEG